MRFVKPLPTQLMRARELFVQRFRPNLLSHGLTEQKWRIMRALAQLESASIRDLGERCAIHPASLSRILPALERDGIVARTASRTDNRRVVVALSARGKVLFRRVAADNDKVFEQVVREIGPARFERAYRALEELIDALSQPRAESGPSAAKRNGAARAAP
jgi:homoprotocatechuate degradation regulator HpaR